MNYEDYFTKVHGGWLGRLVGSQLGIPLEFKPYRYINWKYCSKGTKDLTYYIHNINPKAVNDDEIYEIIGLLALEIKGPDISANDIAHLWNILLYKRQYTAEKVALNNIRKGIYPPDSASLEYGNIWYDAIGAQMKADIWGLISPGCPKIAAEYAQIDGSVAHQGVGIDGEIYIAAMVANAFEESDILTLISSSLEILPKTSEYRKFIEKCIEIYNKNPKWRDGRIEMLHEWDQIRLQLQKDATSWYRKIHYLGFWDFLHVLPNAGVIALSLLYGANDACDPFGRPICIAGMMALDTDCNCGNIGTVMGAIFGADKIPNKWTSPLNNEFHTYVKGYENWKISELSHQTAKMGVKIMKSKCPEKIILEM